MRLIGPDAMRWILGLGFIAMAAWMLVPDKIDEDRRMLAAAQNLASSAPR